ncbi:heme ABC exporter ATP-binding protein CcmA [Methylocystis bryophila]|uniref:Heme ABC exporter, ATP-binding protein CcmA n=1 Tax=Methylocystis bryophila TaxID=655015 RepID=A0A1W6MTA3_9HYPH|nr:heme ABC exporter ATP-binding protein CcmA [Methylocystis bryophila]ARN80841.1 heme ABC exporter, ATP-binding protein CcmA [Methylocystis bryophila]BDV40927.1 cytochrome c biogenesis ATP-binding export protein CcmA [Methylocystis bryophila]
MDTPQDPEPKALAFTPLVADSLCVERGRRLVLENVSFSLTSGESLRVTGRNGAGKSTLLRALAGLLPMRSGRVRLGVAEGEDTLVATHYLAHADGLRGVLTALENLQFWRALLSAPASAGGLSPSEALARVGLAALAETPIGVLSAGQKRRIALARLFVARRPLWLLDEPLTALDSKARDHFAQAMREHCQEGGILVVATHDPLGFETTRTLELGAGGLI